MAVPTVPFSWDRIMNAAEKVRVRLERAAAALKAAGVPYAIAGGNAVAVHVARVDETMVRNTRDVDILIRRADFDAVRVALEAQGFIYRHVAGLDIFLDGAGTKAGEGVHLLFAAERVRPTDPAPIPDVTESEDADRFRVITLHALVQTKLIAFRDKDRTHLRDMLAVGLLDDSWPSRLPAELGSRLQLLLDDPNG
jgi:hypothetical protein